MATQVTSEEWKRWGGAILSTFVYGVAQEAKAVGGRFEEADIMAHIYSAQIGCRLVFDRLGKDATPDEASAEFRRILKQGVTKQEAVLVDEIREKTAVALERKPHELSHELARRLREAVFQGWIRRMDTSALAPSVGTRRALGGRAPRGRRNTSSIRCRSPGSSTSDDDPDPHDLVVVPISEFRSEIECVLGART